MVNICINIIQRMLPEYCQLCGQHTRSRFPLCRDCFRELPLNKFACVRCAQPLPETRHVEPVCGHCQKTPPSFDSVIAPFLYQQDMRALVARLKFGNDLSTGRLLSQLFLKQYAGSNTRLPRALIPMPMDTARLKLRGFNQARELAAPISKQLKIPILDRHVVRRGTLPPQSSLNREARRRNIRNAFSLNRDPLPDHIVIIDDVLTTGASADALAQRLKSAGCTRVDVWVIARTP